MKMYAPPPIPKAIEDQVAAQLRANPDPEPAIALMRSLGLFKIDSIKLLRNHGGISLHDGKDLVTLSPTWADHYEADERFHDMAEQAMAMETEEISTAP